MEQLQSSKQPGVNWRTLTVLAVIAAVAWWVWRRKTTVPPVALQPNTPPPAVAAPPGIPATLPAKMAQVTDTRIPVVMTSGSQVPYGDDEIKQIVGQALERLNSLDERVSLIQIVSSAKTQDSYKTVSYEIVINVHDARERVGLTMAISALVPVSGKLFLRAFKLYNTPADKDAGPPPATLNGGAGFAPFEDPVSILRQLRVS